MDPCGPPPGSPGALGPFPSAFVPEEGPAEREAKAKAKAGVPERKARGSGKVRRSGKRGSHPLSPPPPPPSSSSPPPPPPPPPSEALSGGGGGGKQVQRNAANARERARMRVLSKAFSRLKTTLPWVPPDTKLSKLDTLRLASSYIAHLRQVLASNDKHQDGYGPPLNLTWPFMVASKPENDLKEAVNAARLCGPTAS